MTEAADPARTLFAAEPADPNANLLDVAWTVAGSGIRIRYAEGATFWIAAALDDIWLTFEPPLTAADAAHFLLEPVLGFLLRSRGTLALHASAVEMDGKAVVFCGPGGAGKSTAAGACVAAGGALLSDDVVAVADLGGRWHAHRGASAIRVWDDGAAALVGDADRAPRFSPTWEKRVLSPALLGGRQATGPTPVALVCIVDARSDTADAPRLDPLTGHAGLRALIPLTVANALLTATDRAQELAQLADLITRVPAVRLIAHANPARVPAVVELLKRRLSG